MTIEAHIENPSQGGATTRAYRRGPAARLGVDELARLVSSAASGDAGAWDTLVLQFGGLVWAVARAHRLGDADAADVSQATWLALLENLERIQEPARLGAWLATTARRECLRVFRSAKRHVLVGDELPYPEPSEAPADEALLAAERDAALWQSFSGLRAGDQALLRMLMADPRPDYEVISAALDIPIGSIGPTRARALERLRQALASEGNLSLMCAA
ncbi:MAG TPA: sigma-70 family RNA polymerase sigma factor [Solirubrobacteraceae bacterium]|nr:sigma-70 family RNA polymerase sigma factor [Solirubrobacteraceae bacterium]